MDCPSFLQFISGNPVSAYRHIIRNGAETGLIFFQTPLQGTDSTLFTISSTCLHFLRFLQLSCISYDCFNLPALIFQRTCTVYDFFSVNFATILLRSCACEKSSSLAAAVDSEVSLLLITTFAIWLMPSDTCAMDTA